MTPRLLLTSLSAAAATAFVLTGCASNDAATTTTADSTPIQATTLQTGAYANQPIADDAIVLRVNGMSCPKCANNIDKQLTSIPGVGGARVDMGAGEVTVSFDSKASHPSQQQLADAIERSGFTLVGMRPAAESLQR